MMNRRPGVTARVAEGDELRYLQAVQAAASHMYRDDGTSLILVRRDVATRDVVVHEWLHRRFAIRDAGLTIVQEHERIESFLRRHRRTFRLDD